MDRVRELVAFHLLQIEFRDALKRQKTEQQQKQQQEQHLQLHNTTNTSDTEEDYQKLDLELIEPMKQVQEYPLTQYNFTNEDGNYVDSDCEYKHNKNNCGKNFTSEHKHKILEPKFYGRNKDHHSNGNSSIEIESEAKCEHGVDREFVDEHEMPSNRYDESYNVDYSKRQCSLCGDDVHGFCIHRDCGIHDMLYDRKSSINYNYGEVYNNKESNMLFKSKANIVFVNGDLSDDGEKKLKEQLSLNLGSDCYCITDASNESSDSESVQILYGGKNQRYQNTNLYHYDHTGFYDFEKDYVSLAASESERSELYSDSDNSTLTPDDSLTLNHSFYESSSGDNFNSGCSSNNYKLNISADDPESKKYSMRYPLSRYHEYPLYTNPHKRRSTRGSSLMRSRSLNIPPPPDLNSPLPNLNSTFSEVASLYFANLQSEFSYSSLSLNSSSCSDYNTR